MVVYIQRWSCVSIFPTTQFHSIHYLLGTQFNVIAPRAWVPFSTLILNQEQTYIERPDNENIDLPLFGITNRWDTFFFVFFSSRENLILQCWRGQNTPVRRDKNIRGGFAILEHDVHTIRFLYESLKMAYWIRVNPKNHNFPTPQARFQVANNHWRRPFCRLGIAESPECRIF